MQIQFPERRSIMKKIAILVTIPFLTLLTASLASGTTIPAGTTLVVRTLQSITSRDVPGTRFPVQLENNVVVRGTVALRAGTRGSGQVITSRRTQQSSQRFTVDITELVVNGRSIPVKTTGAVQLNDTRFSSRRGGRNIPVEAANFPVAAGRSIQVQLARPLQF